MLPGMSLPLCPLCPSTNALLLPAARPLPAARLHSYRAAPQLAREPRVHRGDHVSVVWFGCGSVPWVATVAVNNMQDAPSCLISVHHILSGWRCRCRFETFDAPALHIGVQAVLALYASWAAAERQPQQARVSWL